jgi:hypothetical protein
MVKINLLLVFFAYLETRSYLAFNPFGAIVEPPILIFNQKDYDEKFTLNQFL